VRRRAASLAVVVGAMVPVLLGAQERSRGSMGGSCQLGPGFECSYDASMELSEDGRQLLRLESVIIWRAPGSLVAERRARTPDSAVALAYRDVARAADEAGRSFSGSMNGTYWTAMLSPGMRRMWDWTPGRATPPDSIFVADSAFQVPPGDTMLVILIDGVHTIDGPAPRVAASFRLPNRPMETGQREWTNGDTTFVVRPRGRRVRIEGELREIPEVRAFIERPRSP
jgi:hypothetical protein